LGPETQRETAEAAACQMIDTANRLRTPTALLLRRGTFPASAEAFAKKTAYPNRELAVIEVLKALPNDIPVVGTTGKISREIDAYCATRSQAPTPFLTVGGMGHANMIAGGIALQNPERPVACLDGDGAILMHTGNLATCAQLPNLVHIVFNNRVHDSVGGLPTSAPNLDLAALARVAGYASATCLMSAADIGPAVRSVFGRRGAAFIEIMVSPGARSDLGRPKTSPTENKSKFMAKLGASNV
ncbi:MAG: thiamine pyrophosphate-dependent enzyme, partial [Pseudomonadota bacterium]